MVRKSVWWPDTLILLKQKGKKGKIKARTKKEQAAILAKLQAVKPTQQIPEQPSKTTESKNLKMQEESQQKRRFRYKLHSKRKVNFDEEGLEDQFPK